MMAISEYDAFGPWIYEIDEDHPVPRLFAPYIPAEEPLMLFKIPRSIERRNATPDMDLYDCVVGAYAERICILTRADRSVQAAWVAYEDIEGLCLRRHFLEGVLTLYLKRGETALTFNAVSMDVVKRFVVLIRDRSRGDAPPLPDTLAERQETASLDPLFGNLLRDLRAEGETPLLYAWQPVAVRHALDRSGLRDLRERLWPQRLPATLHVLTPEELIVIQQDAAPGRDGRGKFIYHYFYLPLSGLVQTEVRPSEGFAETVCSVSLADHTLSYPVEPGTHSVLALYETLAQYLEGRQTPPV